MDLNSDRLMPKMNLQKPIAINESSFDDEIIIRTEFSKGEELNIVPKTRKVRILGGLQPEIESQRKIGKNVSRHRTSSSRVESEISQIVVNYDKLSTRDDERKLSINNKTFMKMGSFENRADDIRLKTGCFNSNSQSTSLIKSYE